MCSTLIQYNYEIGNDLFPQQVYHFSIYNLNTVYTIIKNYSR